jgi:hypothetical protein
MLLQSFPGPFDGYERSVGKPDTGSTARIRTAAGKPSFSVTTFNIKYIPYVKYTYACPGGPYITDVRAVNP